MRLEEIESRVKSIEVLLLTEIRKNFINKEYGRPFLANYNSEPYVKKRIREELNNKNVPFTKNSPDQHISQPIIRKMENTVLNHWRTLFVDKD